MNENEESDFLIFFSFWAYTHPIGVTQPFKETRFRYINYAQGEVNRLSGENDKFASNNKAFEAQVSQMSGENDKLSQNNQNLSGEIEKLKEEIRKMAAENEKFAENNRKLEKQVRYSLSHPHDILSKVLIKIYSL